MKIAGRYFLHQRCQKHEHEKFSPPLCFCLVNVLNKYKFTTCYMVPLMKWTCKKLHFWSANAVKKVYLLTKIHNFNNQKQTWNRKWLLVIVIFRVYLPQKSCTSGHHEVLSNLLQTLKVKAVHPGTTFLPLLKKSDCRVGIQSSASLDAWWTIDGASWHHQRRMDR